MGFFEDLFYYFQYPFVWYALIVGVLISLCSSLFGATLVLKRYSYIGDGLSHVAFGAVAVASVVGLTQNTYVVMPVTIACAILLLRVGQSTKIKGDALISMVSVGSLALGYLLLNIFTSSSNVSGDVCDTLFGSVSIVTLTISDVWQCVGLSAFVAVFFILTYNRIFAVTFDQTFMQATGKNVSVYNLIIAVITAIIIVFAMKWVGSLLVSALVVFPALSAMRVFKSFKSVIVCSACVSVVCAILGVFISIVYATPVGATIVAADIVCFFAFYVTGLVLQRKSK